MYYNSLIDIPEVPGKITIRKGIYVMYETGRRYNPEKKYNIPDRVTVGKICAGQEGKMYPNDKFSTYFPDVEFPELNPEADRSSCLKIGTFLVIRKILKEYHLDEMLDGLFHGDSGLFKDLAAYSIITECNAGQYYPDYAFNHPLFTPGYKIYSDTKVSSFFKSVTDDQRICFLNQWNRDREHDETIYISYDSTNKNVQAGEIEMAEFGHAKGDASKPVVNVSMGYDHNNREPLFYEEYPGSIVDVSQLNYTIDKAGGYGYKNIGFILDRGYFSKGNLKYLDEKRMPFIIMAKGNAGFINGFVKKAAGTFETDRTKRISKYHVYGKTLKTKLFPTEDKDRYIHVYFNDLKAAVERENLETKIERMERNLKKIIGTGKETEAYEKFFRFEKDSAGIIAAVAPRNREIERVKKMCGYFVIVTSKRMTAKDALYLYKSRDESEKMFRADKSYLGNAAMRVQTDEALKTKTLVEFVALIIRNRIYTYLDAAIEEGDSRPNYMTVPAAVKELEKIEMTRQTDGIYRLDHAVTATQKVILKALGIDAKTIPNKAKYISEELKKVDGIQF